MSSPVPRHVRRTNFLSQKAVPTATQAKTVDARWSLLDLVRRCRKPLGLKDRDVAVLRGLLSFVSQPANPASLVVFASNKVLIERCDGIDERTLRRRIAHLIAVGLLARRTSPNGKRYQVKDDCAEAKLSYGIDLSPLFAIRDHLTALAEQCLREDFRCKALRAVIRDILYHHGADIAPVLSEHATRSLRRSLSSEQLAEIIEDLRTELPQASPETTSVTADLTVSDRQFDRHIHNSEEEAFDSECAAGVTKADHRVNGGTRKNAEKTSDISVVECMELAKTSASFAPKAAQDWGDVIRLSETLAPAIGLASMDVEKARRTMGALGSTLAILGIVEAYDKIRRPGAYLQALAKRAADEGVDFVRMFRSLTNRGASGGSMYGAARCIPG